MLFLTAFAMAQERNYISTCGKTKTAIKWTEEHKDGKIYLHTVQGGEKHEYILGSGYKTEAWKIADASSNTNLTVSLCKGIYSISGKFNGKQISKTVKSKGKPWYQNIAYNAGLTLKNGKSVEYECFRPDNMKLYTMSEYSLSMSRVSCMKLSFSLLNTSSMRLCFKRRLIHRPPISRQT